MNALMPKQPRCSICNKVYTGFGNNAMPANKGRCCDECNAKVVIPVRLMLMKIQKAQQTE